MQSSLKKQRIIKKAPSVSKTLRLAEQLASHPSALTQPKKKPGEQIRRFPEQCPGRGRTGQPGAASLLPSLRPCRPAESRCCCRCCRSPAPGTGPVSREGGERGRRRRQRRAPRQSCVGAGGPAESLPPRTSLAPSSLPSLPFPAPPARSPRPAPTACGGVPISISR